MSTRETRTAPRGRRTTEITWGPVIAATVAAFAALVASVATAATGDTSPATARGRWLSAGILTGSMIPDEELADYQWDTQPQFGWGAEAVAGIGRFGAGFRVWTSETSQEIGAPGAPEATTVRSTSVELVGRGRVASWWLLDVVALASVGRMHLGYQPDQVTIDLGGTLTSVEFAPIDTWVGGGGFKLEHALAGPLRAGIEVERRWFALDTAHRRGDEIVTQQQTFGEWNARAQLAWRYGKP